VDADDSTADIDQLLRREPILCYRLLRFANSAGLALRMPVDSLSRAVKALGYAQLRAWLREQLPRASSDPDLLPISTAMALRARLMVQLQPDGAGQCPEEDVYLCGLLSQMDLLLGEPLPAVLARLPLPASVKAALLQQNGPIQAALEMATALESDHTDRTRLLCELHQVEAQTVNRVLLQTLAQTRHQPAKSLLLV
jgi:EAL and modified HD-GYP domain-containing signal transduction protein